MRRRRHNPVEERFRRRGVNVRGISRFLDGRVRVTYSDGKSKTFRAKSNPSVAYNVYLDGKLIDTVFYQSNSDADEVKRGLVNHDGYDPSIKVTKARKRRVKANPGHLDPRTTIYGKQIGRKKRSVLSALTTADAVRAIRKVMPGRSKEAYAHMAREHQNRAAEYRRVWSRVADKAAMRAFGRKFQVGDYQISGIGSDAFDERSKSILRTAAVRGSEHARIAAALKVMAGAKMRKVYKLNPLGRVAARGFIRVRRSVTPQFIARRAGVPVSRILSIIGR